MQLNLEVNQSDSWKARFWWFRMINFNLNQQFYHKRDNQPEIHVYRLKQCWSLTEKQHLLNVTGPLQNKTPVSWFADELKCLLLQSGSFGFLPFSILALEKDKDKVIHNTVVALTLKLLSWEVEWRCGMVSVRVCGGVKWWVWWSVVVWVWDGECDGVCGGSVVVWVWDGEYDGVWWCEMVSVVWVWWCE